MRTRHWAIAVPRPGDRAGRLAAPGRDRRPVCRPDGSRVRRTVARQTRSARHRGGVGRRAHRRADVWLVVRCVRADRTDSGRVFMGSARRDGGRVDRCRSERFAARVRHQRCRRNGRCPARGTNFGNRCP